LKLWYLSAELHDVTSQNTEFFFLTTLRSLNIAFCNLFALNFLMKLNQHLLLFQFVFVIVKIVVAFYCIIKGCLYSLQFCGITSDE